MGFSAQNILAEIVWKLRALGKNLGKKLKWGLKRITFGSMPPKKKKLTVQEKQIVRFLFFLAGLGLVFSCLLPFIM
jgi:hypothetical protein